MQNIPRPEYPRPQFVRGGQNHNDLWLNLNGEWDFKLDPTNQGLADKWFEKTENITDTIQVPFCYQSPLSQVADKSPSNWCWYHRKFTLPTAMAGKEIILHFGAVDYLTHVYIGGRLVGTHEGGHTNFSFNITPYLTGQVEEDITLYVYDPTFAEDIPRGKQSWTGGSHSIWYTPTTGIWQTVWLEAVEKTYIKNIRFTPNVDRGSVAIEAVIAGPTKGLSLCADIAFKGEAICHASIAPKNITTDNTIRMEAYLFEGKVFNTSFHSIGMMWTPEHPNLFDVTIQLHANGTKLDHAESYFGLRKIHTQEGKVYLNNRPYYQKLVLDQGYWPGGLLTAPTDEDFVTDIKLTKEMGFNGARKHQKVEDPRFMYWADKLGFLVWGECAAAPSFTPEAVSRLTREWLEIIERDYNHPCIVSWVPFNESWGVPNVQRCPQEQAHTMGLYYTLKSLDSTRLVVGNDGWEMTKTDICAIHSYSHANYEDYKYGLATLDNMEKSNFVHRQIFADGYQYEGQPVLLTEFGGVAYKVDGSEGWGYTTTNSPEGLVAEYSKIIDAIKASDYINGYCYTQITDVEQEVNGLLTYQRVPKCDTAKIKAINDRI